MKLSAIISDVDGTLIDLDGQYNPQVPILIAELRAKGVLVSAATGKAFVGEIERVVRELDLSPLIISCGGGLINNWKTKEVLWHRPIPEVSVRRMIDYLASHNYIYSLETQTQAFMPELVKTEAYTDDIEVTVFNPKSPPPGVLKILFHRAANKVDKETIEKPRRELSHLCTDTEVTLFCSEGICGLDITAENATKHTAVLEYAKLVGIDPSTMVAIGDGYNDYPLFTACGLKIAMGNAPQELKAIADKVVAATEKGGMVEALTWLLGKV